LLTAFTARAGRTLFAAGTLLTLLAAGALLSGGALFATGLPLIRRAVRSDLGRCFLTCSRGRPVLFSASAPARRRVDLAARVLAGAAARG
jgi:hypothetical protein